LGEEKEKEAGGEKDSLLCIYRSGHARRRRKRETPRCLLFRGRGRKREGNERKLRRREGGEGGVPFSVLRERKKGRHARPERRGKEGGKMGKGYLLFISSLIALLLLQEGGERERKKCSQRRKGGRGEGFVIEAYLLLAAGPLRGKKRTRGWEKRRGGGGRKVPGRGKKKEL